MTQDADDRVTELSGHETELVLDSFDHAAAQRLGALMVERALHDGAPIIIDIRRPTMILFRAALAGTTPENEIWLERKARTVFRFEMSTALLGARFAAQGVDLWAADWFDTDTFTPAGGSFPVRVRGVGVVAAVTVSGLTSEEDHDFAVQSLRAFGRPPAAVQHTSSSQHTASIQHTVAFSLRHPGGSPAEADFLSAARALATIPGVQDYQQLRQTSPKSDFTFSFSMHFADDAAYQAYNLHPIHVAFVRDRWESEVSDFAELDFVSLTAG